MVRNIFGKFAGLPIAAIIVAAASLAGAQNAAAQTNCSLRVLTENNPFPDNTPNEVSGNMTFSDTAVSTQTATIPASGNPMNSVILYVNERDCPVRVDSVTITDDGGAKTPVFDGLFGGMTLAAGVYTFPTGAEVFAGAANTEATIYPLNITGGATVEITGQVQLGDPACDDTSVLRFEDAFGGATVDCATDTYTWPTGAEPWAGFGDTARGSGYPFMIPYGATITFDGSTAGAAADVTFQFENNPFPNNSVIVRPAAVSVSGATASYSIDVPAEAATLNNLLLYVETRDVPVTVTNITVTPNPAPPGPAVTPVPVLPFWGILGLIGLVGFLGLRRRV
jgi:MYXO-CTERM domain-containing protein